MKTDTIVEDEDLFSWFQGIRENIDKDLVKSIKSTGEDINNNDVIVKHIGIVMKVDPELWGKMTNVEKLQTIYDQLPDVEKKEFDEQFQTAGKRNKSKKPKRRNSRSKRRNSRSKRRKNVSKRRR